ncbi:kinase-like domain-containing protein, partial [Amanita rubescens]
SGPGHRNPIRHVSTPDLPPRPSSRHWRICESGYGQLPHFECLAMELLGPSVKDCATGRLAVTTVVRVVLQMLSALDHIHKHGFVHQDIKPENVLSSPTDPSRVFLIDFGLKAYRWNAPLGKSQLARWHCMRRIRESKAAASGDKLGESFPAEFGYLLDYSRGLECDQMPDYEGLKRRFTDLNGRQGGKDVEGPLDWSSTGTSISEEHSGSVITHSDSGSDTESEDENDEEEKFENSYFSWDIADWDLQGARDRSLTLPIELAELGNCRSNGGVSQYAWCSR